MIIPKDPIERDIFYQNVIEKCLVSVDTRKTDYHSLRSWYLFGSGPDEAPAHYNKIYSHIDQLNSFLYSAETTRFSINLGASVPDGEHKKTPRLAQHLNDKWLDSNADQVFSSALTWALVYNSTFIKLIYNRGINPYMVEPGSIGILREDVSYTDRQEAIVHTYYTTRSELMSRLYSHPKRKELAEKVTSSQRSLSDVPQGIDRLILSQTSPTIYGNVNLDMSGYNRMKAEVSEETIEMRELWIWNDETMDYQVVTMAEPHVFIYDRPGEQVFLKGEHPFVQICPNPQYDYFWGFSETQRLVLLQQMRNKRVGEILQLLEKQVNPPKVFMGFGGIADEKYDALSNAGTWISNDMPNAKVENLAPDIPDDLFKEVREIDEMFAEASGMSNVLSGRGEHGVRSQGHASQLARLGSSRAKKRALVIEDSLEKIATLYLKLIQVYDNVHLTDEDGIKFIPDQFTKDYTVKVDAHSNSPVFMEDMRQLAFNLFKAQAIDKESLLDLLEPPMKQLLKDKLKKKEAQQAAQAAQGGGQEEEKPKKDK